MDITTAITLICGLLAILVTVDVPIWQRRVAAADTFRQTILNELEGIYPKHNRWTDAEYRRINNSINTVKTASEQFSVVLSKRRYKKFYQAVEDYCNHAESISSIETSKYYVELELTKTAVSKYSPVDKLIKDIETLLSFAR
jgi:hypothetical protein